MTVVTYAAQKVLQAMPDTPKGMKAADNPFVRSKDKVYLRYNKIESVNAKDGLGGILHTFYWNDMAVAHMRVEHIRYDSEQIVTLSGIDGRMQITAY